MRKIKKVWICFSMLLICCLFPFTSHADVNSATFNGHKYRIISNGLKGFEAESFCESIGGYLAIIDSAEENAFLFDFCQRAGYKSVYFGITDEATEGNWKTVKGDSLKYTNWSKGEPNGGTKENWAMFYWKYSDGKWNDGSFDYPYLCEWDDANLTKGSYNGHTYEIFENCSTWEEAAEYCRSLGGYLAVIDDSEENSYLYNWLVNQGYTSAYFGLQDKDLKDEWTDAEGMTVSYLNWGTGEPNHEGNVEKYGMFYWKLTDGKWNDGDFGNKTDKGGKAFICEWGDKKTNKETNQYDLSASSITLSKVSYKYDGKNKEPAVTVKYGGKELSKENYSVSYENNKYVGKASVLITGKGDYSGTVTKNFEIKSPGKIVLNFNANGGTVSTKSKKVNRGSKYGTLPQPKKNGCSFLGWYTAKKGGKKITASSYVEVTKKQTLYAQWSNDTYTITYNLNGGTNSEKNPESYTVSTKTFTFDNPIRMGYIFKGWYTDSKYKKNIKKLSKGTTGNMTLYAKWTPVTYSIEFDGNGVLAGKMTSMKSLKYGECYNLKKNTYKAPEGKQFKEWNTKKNGSGRSYKDQEMIADLSTKNGTKIKLYAQWQLKRYKIDYVLNGGENNSNNVVDFDISEKKEIRNGYRIGYTFGGWYTNSKLDGKVITNVSQLPAKAVTLYAKWIPITYTIRFDGNGKVTDVPKTIICKYDMNYTIPGSTLKGFRYWSLNKDGSGTTLSAGASVSNLTSQDGATIVLYAYVRNELVYTDYLYGVNQGSVRYVYQLGDFENNGWGKYAYIAKNECGFASQSMALSYIGVDASPEYLCGSGWSTGYGTYFTYGLAGIKVVPGSNNNVAGSEGARLVEQFYASYEKDDFNGIISPVIVHYRSEFNQHTIILVNKTEDYYLALDPAIRKKLVKIKFASDGRVIGDVTFANFSPYIDAVQQYQRIY